MSAMFCTTFKHVCKCGGPQTKLCRYCIGASEIRLCEEAILRRYSVQRRSLLGSRRRRIARDSCFTRNEVDRGIGHGVNRSIGHCVKLCVKLPVAFCVKLGGDCQRSLRPSCCINLRGDCLRSLPPSFCAKLSGDCCGDCQTSRPLATSRLSKWRSRRIGAEEAKRRPFVPPLQVAPQTLIRAIHISFAFCTCHHERSRAAAFLARWMKYNQRYRW